MVLYIVYKLKIIIGKPTFSDEYKNITKRYKSGISYDSLHAWFITQ